MLWIQSSEFDNAWYFYVRWGQWVASFREALKGGQHTADRRMARRASRVKDKENAAAASAAAAAFAASGGEEEDDDDELMAAGGGGGQSGDESGDGGYDGGYDGGFDGSAAGMGEGRGRVSSVDTEPSMYVAAGRHLRTTRSRSHLYPATAFCFYCYPFHSTPTPPPRLVSNSTPLIPPFHVPSPQVRRRDHGTRVDAGRPVPLVRSLRRGFHRVDPQASLPRVRPSRVCIVLPASDGAHLDGHHRPRQGEP